MSFVITFTMQEVRAAHRRFSTALLDRIYNQKRTYMPTRDMANNMLSKLLEELGPEDLNKGKKNITSSQRNVSKQLGRNQTHYHEKIYNEIEKRLGPTKICNFGHIRGSKTGVKHEGNQMVSIRDFELRGCKILENGEIEIANGCGLQGFCKICSKRRRRRRLEMSREKNKGGFDTYEKEYGKTYKTCSICKENKDVRKNFKLSPGMECGIHNICTTCSKTYGESMGDRLVKYRPDGKFKYKKTEEGQHDDHHMPLKFGGTNEEVNHRLLTAVENLKKSSTIPYHDVKDIPPEELCERWRPILKQVQQEQSGNGSVSITIFESRISSAILEEQKKLYSKTDEEMEIFCKKYNKKNNRRVNTKRCVKKFRKYCKDILHL